jgi:hypothetical protein
VVHALRRERAPREKEPLKIAGIASVPRGAPGRESASRIRPPSGMRIAISKGMAISGCPGHPLRAAGALVAALTLAACALFRSGAPTASAPRPIAELVDPAPNIAARDLFCGAGGCDEAPPADAAFQFRARHDRGSSPNLVVEDARGRVWNAKLGKEVKPEIAASRLIWAIGFHQPPIYYVRNWTVSGGPDPGPQPEARFRLKRRHWKKGGEWDWQDNPFVGTRELRGLIVLMAMITNWDLKTSNNVIYERRSGAAPARQYVVKDLGESFGRSVRFYALGKGNDIGEFEREGFIRRVDGDRVEFHYQPIILNLHVTREIAVDDVLWTCRRLAQLSDRQWADAFRAAGYTDPEGAAFSARLRQKVQEGLALARATDRNSRESGATELGGR